VLTDVSEELISSIFSVNEKEENPRAKNQREQVQIVVTDVSEELISSIFRVEEKRRKSASKEPA
jgi:hypothetical protein